MRKAVPKIFCILSYIKMITQRKICVKMSVGVKEKKPVSVLYPQAFSNT